MFIDPKSITIYLQIFIFHLLRIFIIKGDLIFIIHKYNILELK